MSNTNIMPIFGGSLGTQIPTVYESSTLVSSSVYFAVVSASSPITLELSASRNGQTHIVKDLAGNCSVHNITVSSSTGQIDGSSTFTLVSDFSSYTFVYVQNNNVWSVL